MIRIHWQQQTIKQTAQKNCHFYALRKALINHLSPFRFLFTPLVSSSIPFFSLRFSCLMAEIKSP
jgi:hypothetical protein